MITKKELEDFARLKRLSLGNAEKDYLIDIALLSISGNTKNELVFKVGTCLYKFYKLNRFSEDLDFSLTSKIDINKLIAGVISDFERFGIKAVQHRKKEPYNSVLIGLRIEGPLFSGKPVTYASIGIDINLKSGIILQPEALAYSPVYPEIAQFNLLCMKQEEIFAEKIRAIMTRQRARDLFDLNFLLRNNVFAGKKLIDSKMEYYNEKFDLRKLFGKLSGFSEYWKKELTGFTPNLESFEQIKEFTEKKLKELYS